MRSLPCVRKFWGEARASIRQSGSDYNGLMVALTKMKPYVAKALLENPNPENIALNNAYESEVKCAKLQTRNYSQYGHAVCNPSNKMDYTIQAAQHTLARIEQAKDNDLSSNDLSCKELINIAAIWHKTRRENALAEQNGNALRFKGGRAMPQSENGATYVSNPDNQPNPAPANQGTGTLNDGTETGDGGQDEDEEVDCDCDDDKEDAESCPTADPDVNDGICASEAAIKPDEDNFLGDQPETDDSERKEIEEQLRNISSCNDGAENNPKSHLLHLARLPQKADSGGGGGGGGGGGARDGGGDGGRGGGGGGDGARVVVAAVMAARRSCESRSNSTSTR